MLIFQETEKMSKFSLTVELGLQAPKWHFPYLFWENNGFHMLPLKQAVTCQIFLLFFLFLYELKTAEIWKSHMDIGYSIFQIWTIKLLELKTRQWHLNNNCSQAKFHQAELKSQQWFSIPSSSMLDTKLSWVAHLLHTQNFCMDQRIIFPPESTS